MLKANANGKSVSARRYIFHLLATPISSGLTLVFILAFFEIQSFQDGLIQYLPVFAVIKNNPVASIVVTIFVHLCVALYEARGFIRWRKSVIKPTTLDGSLRNALFNLIDNPSAEKSKELCHYIDAISASDKKDNVLTHVEFCKIVTPVRSIEVIANAIHHVHSIKCDYQFEVVIFFLREKRTLQAPLVCCPPNKRPEFLVDILNEPDSAVMDAATYNRTNILEDVDDPQGYIQFKRVRGDTRKGSLLCHPVYIPFASEVRMVVSIFTPGVANHFKEEDVDTYNLIFDKFKTRLIVEYCYLAIQDLLKPSVEVGNA